MLASACTDNQTDPSPDLPYPEFGERQTSFTDTELRQAIYTDYRYPESFYQETPEGSIYYLNSWSLQTADEREWPPLPICTENLDTARTWSEEASLNGAYYRPLVSERTDPKYFEFKRIDPDSRHFLLSRVHRCSYFQPAVVWWFWEEDTLGTYVPRPATPEGIEELIEYLWFVEHYNLGGSAVLSSFADSTAVTDSVLHRLFTVLAVFGDRRVRDRITLSEHRLTASRESGLLLHKRKEIRTIDGR
jgi:hypothetical protein